MKRAAGLALFVLALAVAHPASACDCQRLKPLTPAVRTEAPIIFEGRVVEIVDRSLHTTRTTPSDSTGEIRPLGREIIFLVSRAWAGVTSRRVSLFVNDSDCAFTFEVGHPYVVFAHRDSKERMTTNICSRTSAADRARDVLQALGRPRPLRRTGTV